MQFLINMSYSIGVRIVKQFTKRFTKNILESRTTGLLLARSERRMDSNDRDILRHQGHHWTLT